jgi:hypothetical protein
MFPTIDDRLACVSRALETVIIPALPAEESLAIEQAYLSVVHIRALIGHAAGLTAALETELQEARSLLDELRAIGQTHECEKKPLDLPSPLPEHNQKILSEVNRTIRRIGESEDDRQWSALRAPVVRHARARARAEAHWFAGLGMPSMDGE